MANYNKQTLVGRLGRDAETRYTPNGAMNVTFSVAYNPPKFGDKEQETVWYTVTAWGKLAERLDNASQQGWFGKGAEVLVEGRPSLRTWQRKDGGGTGYSLEINATEVITLKSIERAPQTEVDPAPSDDIPF